VFEEFRAAESVGYGGLDGLEIKSLGELDVLWIDVTWYLKDLLLDLESQSDLAR
jgi:hypothetical protein